MNGRGYTGDKETRGGYTGDKETRGGYTGDKETRGGYTLYRGQRDPISNVEFSLCSGDRDDNVHYLPTGCNNVIAKLIF